MTPRELNLVLRGYGKRVEQIYEAAAWHISYVVNMFAKNPVTPAQLLGRKEESPTGIAPTVKNVTLMWLATETDE